LHKDRLRRTQIYISREVNIFSDLDAKELIQELKSISKMLQLEIAGM